MHSRKTQEAFAILARRRKLINYTCHLCTLPNEQKIYPVRPIDAGDVARGKARKDAEFLEMFGHERRRRPLWQPEATACSISVFTTDPVVPGHTMTFL